MLHHIHASGWGQTTDGLRRAAAVVLRLANGRRLARARLSHTAGRGQATEGCVEQLPWCFVTPTAVDERVEELAEELGGRSRGVWHGAALVSSRPQSEATENLPVVSPLEELRHRNLDGEHLLDPLSSLFPPFFQVAHNHSFLRHALPDGSDEELAAACCTGSTNL